VSLLVKNNLRMSRRKTHRRKIVRELNYKQIIRDVLNSYLVDEDLNRRISISRICLESGDTVGNVQFSADEKRYLKELEEKYRSSNQSSLVDLGVPFYSENVDEHLMVMDLIYKKQTLVNYKPIGSYGYGDSDDGEIPGGRLTGRKPQKRRMDRRRRKKRRRKPPGIAMIWKILFFCIVIFFILRWLNH